MNSLKLFLALVLTVVISVGGIEADRTTMSGSDVGNGVKVAAPISNGNGAKTEVADLTKTNNGLRIDSGRKSSSAGNGAKIDGGWVSSGFTVAKSIRTGNGLRFDRGVDASKAGNGAKSTNLLKGTETGNG